MTFTAPISYKDMRPLHEWGYGHDQEHQKKLESGWYKAFETNPEVGSMNPREFEEWKKAKGLPPTQPTPIGLGGEKTKMVPLPYNPDTDQSEMVPLPYKGDRNTNLIPLGFLEDFLKKGGFLAAITDGNRTGSYSNRSLGPDGTSGFWREGDIQNTGGFNGQDYIFYGGKWIKRT